MANELTEFGGVTSGEIRPLKERLGWLEEWRVGRIASKEASRALARVEQHRIGAVERASCFAIDIATDKVIGVMAAAAVDAAGAIEVRLNTNAGAAVETLDQVEVARVVSSIGTRNSTLQEVADLRAAGEIGEAEQGELAELLEHQHRRRMASARDNGEASRKRINTLVAGGLTAVGHLDRGE